jgi:hypothetical protein
LTVRTGVPDAAIDVPGVGHFVDQVTDLPCPPGSYAISVSAPKYQAVTNTVEVVAGKSTTASLPMEPDPQFVRNELTTMKDAFSNRNYTSAITSAHYLLAVDRKNKDALKLIAESYFLTDDFQAFETAAVDTLDVGGDIQLRLNHHHVIGSQLHPVSLTISAKTLSFDPELSKGTFCEYKAFTNPVETLEHAELTQNKYNELYLDLRIRDPKNHRILNLRFTDLEAHFVATQKVAFGGVLGYTGQLLISRSQAADELTSIVQLLKHVAPDTH